MNDKKELIKRTIVTPSTLYVRESGEDGKESRTIEGYAILFNVPSAPLYADEEEEIIEIIDPSALSREFLDKCDIKFTMFHDRQLILARSVDGKGTLTYEIDEKGVSFSFEAPKTIDGDKALELVRRGDIAGCSFMFATHYYDSAYVERSVERKNGKSIITYRVKLITGVYDFTLAADPAYPDTSVDVREREFTKELENPVKPDLEKTRKVREQVAQMKKVSQQKII